MPTVSGFKSVKFTIENVNNEKKIKRKLIKQAFFFSFARGIFENQYNYINVKNKITYHLIMFLERVIINLNIILKKGFHKWIKRK